MCGGKFTRWRKGGYSVEGKGEGGAYSGGGLEEYRIWDMVLFRMLLAKASSHLSNFFGGGRTQLCTFMQ